MQLVYQFNTAWKRYECDLNLLFIAINQCEPSLDRSITIHTQTHETNDLNINTTHNRTTIEYEYTIFWQQLFILITNHGELILLSIQKM